MEFRLWGTERKKLLNGTIFTAEALRRRVSIPRQSWGLYEFGPLKGPEETPHPVSYLDHLLPWEKEKLFLGRCRRPTRILCPTRILFPLPGERVARAARFHQRARVG